MSWTLLSIMFVTWIVALRCYGAFSFVTAGVFCFSVYSIPALVGMVRPFDDALISALVPASAAAIAATALAWSTLCLVIALPVRGRRTPTRIIPVQDMPSAAAFLTAGMYLCFLGYLAIAATDGPLFFLSMRDDLTESFVRLLWRWLNALGLVCAVATRAKKPAIVFGIAVIMHFLSGDRTVIIITAFCVLVVWGQGRSIGVLLRPHICLSMLALVVIGIIGKPIYLAVKLGSLDIVLGFLTSDRLGDIVFAFEPFTTFNILNLVITREFQLPLSTLVENSIGQLMIIPSAFGLDGNSFNAAFTAKFVPDIQYGVAGNFWAQGWAVGGPIGVSVFAMIFGITLRACDRGTRSTTGAVRLFWALSGATIAVYAHRNALDNLLSFMRQIGIVVVLIAVCSKMLAPFYRSAITSSPKTLRTTRARSREPEDTPMVARIPEGAA